MHLPTVRPECRSIFWSNPMLTNWIIVGKHDPSKEEIHEVVNIAQAWRLRATWPAWEWYTYWSLGRISSSKQHRNCLSTYGTDAWCLGCMRLSLSRSELARGCRSRNYLLFLSFRTFITATNVRSYSLSFEGTWSITPDQFCSWHRRQRHSLGQSLG